MANRTEDEWSLVSDNEEVLSDMSFDEVDPEPEMCYRFSQTPVSLNVQPRVTLTRSSFPERLRATTAAMRPLAREVEQPKYTEVTPFKQDQSTQVDFKAPPVEAQETRATLLRDVSDRSMTISNQLRAKSQDNERLSLRIAELESQQAKLSAEYQDNLKAIADNLRRENADLRRQNTALQGEDESLAVRSLTELEELETMLARGMENVRSALRTKYRAAMEKHREHELCVVCFEKPVSVVLLPCRHQVLCASCALRVTSCPIDRQDIQDKALTYGLNAYTTSSS
ncbi:uncharacterized protein PITG_12143 [Phytophthora infestans T30-4]|uniref:RING-type domain-containing protein n=1 Tax=Phytophthora infestans (strain T30-4) TaxID=403677 RepID=D0NJ52_PHYIT|nr:uncharacterized protein PITG_12143 [Phytophthora infestans T30-4]EEY59570.1 conserved hypothetical protein [Phytophthora infestans T30-4]|eukprot:XP_002900763.1 conserved hypothetical protein [Phytophthora infestans T30-4]